MSDDYTTVPSNTETDSDPETVEMSVPPISGSIVWNADTLTVYPEEMVTDDSEGSEHGYYVAGTTVGWFEATWDPTDRDRYYLPDDMGSECFWVSELLLRRNQQLKEYIQEQED